MNLSNSKKISFNGLNEIRAIASLAVVLHHLELFKNRENLYSLYNVPYYVSNFIGKIGHNGVVLFFTLSGFLITYLLLQEKKRFNTIDIKAFYVRRILRIWPLYFIIVVIGFVLMPIIANFSFFDNQTYYPKLINKIEYPALILFLFFLSNFALSYFKPIAGASQSWSVSVEEQFYLLWPWLVKKLSTKKLSVIVIALPILKKLLLLFSKKMELTFLTKTLQVIEIEFMCVGAVAAILLFKNKIPPVFFKYSKYILIIAITTTLFLTLRYNNIIIINILFALIILLVSQSTLKNKILFYLGTTSYGIYMYHPLCMFVCFSLAKHITSNIVMLNIIFYVTTIASTIIISHLSYHYFEIKFLKHKHKFTKVDSGA